MSYDDGARAMRLVRCMYAVMGLCYAGGGCGSGAMSRTSARDRGIVSGLGYVCRCGAYGMCDKLARDRVRLCRDVRVARDRVSAYVYDSCDRIGYACELWV